jgi:hypothetical protein
VTPSIVDVQGYGVSYSWRVLADGVEIPRGEGVPPFVMAYSGPSALSLSMTSGVPTTAAAAVNVTVTGVDLWPDCAVVTVTVGRWVWLPVECSYSSLTVLTTPGAGAGLALNVTVGPLWAVAVASTVAYASPTITALLSSRLLTAGE